MSSDCIFNETLVLQKTFCQCKELNIKGFMIFLHPHFSTVRFEWHKRNIITQNTYLIQVQSSKIALRET